jgi:GNAT superfamily N-acetyltransferase
VTSEAELVYLELDGLQAPIPHPRPGLPAGISLRVADPAIDLDGIASLYNTAFDRDLPEHITAERVAAYAQHPGLGPSGVILAFDCHTIVGLIVAKLEVPAPGQEAREGSLELLAVHPAYQGRGLGIALAHRALSWLAGQGVKIVSATTDHPAALAILRQLGFQALGDQGGAAVHKAAGA